ncbi:MAG: hypothetical protein K0S14_2558 [Thermomicrobiales bacterium]|jgi:uncharacterized membrane protein|nr:hypothetical protein [Thermomicrobiales bacterium]MDF2758267.1 hypothetical protein [Thermomicrobiales bacterium]
MSLGPIEMLVVKFPGNRFSGEIIPALAELVENGTVRIVDLLFAVKNKQGDVKVLEFGDLDPDIFGQWDPLVSDVTPMLNEDDARELTASLENNSSAALLLFENTWATRFVDAVSNARGEVVVNERIPRAVVQELTAELTATA